MLHLISPEVLVDPAVHSLLGKFTIVKTFNNFFCLSWLTLSSVVVSKVPFEKQLFTKLFLHNLNPHLIPRKLRKNSSDICIHRVTPDSLQSLSDSHCKLSPCEVTAAAHRQFVICFLVAKATLEIASIALVPQSVSILATMLHKNVIITINTNNRVTTTSIWYRKQKQPVMFNNYSNYRTFRPCFNRHSFCAIYT